MMTNSIAVIGAAGIEILSRTEKILSSHESAPGEISLDFGGSGFRIARHLASLGLSPALVTRFGDDAASRLLWDACAAAGVDAGASGVESGSSDAFLSVLSDRDDRVLSLSDTRLFSAADPAFLEERLPVLNQASACVFSADLSRETCLFLCENLSVPLFALGVSPAKCTRLSPVLGRLFGISLSLIEARRLTGRLTPADCAASLCRSGIKLALLSLGAEGFLLASGSDLAPAPFSPRPGREEPARDAAAAALLWGFSERIPLRAIAQGAAKAAALVSLADDPAKAVLTPGILTDLS